MSVYRQGTLSKLRRLGPTNQNVDHKFTWGCQSDSKSDDKFGVWLNNNVDLSQISIFKKIKIDQFSLKYAYFDKNGTILDYKFKNM